MKRPPSQAAPPAAGGYHWGGILEGLSEEEKAGQPLAPPIRYVAPRLDERTLELLRQWDDEAAHPSPPTDNSPAE
jgi:hypothetical protein